MRVTNKHGLPKTLVNLLENDPYDKGAARMSVTGLLTPPRIALLRHQHRDCIEQDVSDAIWAIMGRAIHKVLEDGADEEHLSEERLFAEIDGWVISGGIDVQRVGDAVDITDYKLTSAYAVMNEKPDWARQLNSYAHLVRVAKGLRVRKLSICAMVRDWNRHRVNEPGYPQTPVVNLPIEVWAPGDAEAFLRDRIKLHREAIVKRDMGEELPKCSDEDRWMREPSFAVRKTGNKRATKVFNNHSDAVEYAITRPGTDQWVVEERMAEPIRCTGDYCQVSAFCAQFQRWKEREQNGRQQDSSQSLGDGGGT